MKLFAFYIGGSVENSLVELHDVRFGVGEKIEDCYDAIRQSWWGTPDSLHLDCWGELTSADGHNILLRKEPYTGENKLWFVNLGGYDPDDFNELHKNVFVVAPTESKAKVAALKQILHWKSHHKDEIFDVEKIADISMVTEMQGLHIHLEKSDTIVPFKFSFGFNPAIRKTA